MKESISYSFLLNIIILFIFVCASVIVGIFSYYRAFRAGTIIINEIEKFEGYNCVSQESISRKLSGVSYNLPFDAKCKDGETNCITDEGKNYLVYSYNLDEDGIVENGKTEKISVGNSEYDGASPVTCSGGICKMTSDYQYGVYTYMYFDLPIVSSLIRIPIFNKTRVMHDQRRLYYFERGTGENYTELFLDVDHIPIEYVNNYYYHYIRYVKERENAGLTSDVSPTINYIDALKFYTVKKINENSTEKEVAQKDKYYNEELVKYGYGVRRDEGYLKPESNVRELFKLSESSRLNAAEMQSTGKKMCGTVVDWSLF